MVLPGRFERRLVRRVFSVKIPPLARSDLEKFLEKVSAAVKSHGASIRVEGDKLVIEVYGTPSTVRSSWAAVKRVVSEYSQPPGRGSSYTLLLISREVGLAIPGDVLAAVLRLEGFRAEHKGGAIETNAGFDEVVSAAARVKEALEASRLLHATRTAKKAIVAAAAASGRRVEEVVEAGLRAGVLVEGDDGKIGLKRPWLEVLPDLVAAVGSSLRG